MRSQNKRGGHWADYRERQAWKRLLADVRIDDDGSLPRPTTERMTVKITRLAPTKRYILDVDNFAAGAKRLIDALVEAGFLVDDDRRWIDGPILEQALSDDKCYWVIVVLSVAQQQEAPALEIVRLRDMARTRSRKSDIAQCAKSTRKAA